MGHRFHARPILGVRLAKVDEGEAVPGGDGGDDIPGGDGDDDDTDDEKGDDKYYGDERMRMKLKRCQ